MVETSLIIREQKYMCIRDPFPKVHFLAKSLQVVTIFKLFSASYTSIIITYIIGARFYN